MNNDTPVWRVLILDGRSGSGKTMLAERIAASAGAQVLSLDDLYPGWFGLAQGSAAVPRVLQDGGYHAYDWAARDYSEQWIELDPALPLVIEGCGSLTRTNLSAAGDWADGAAPHGIWLELDEPARRRRALNRDGEMFAPHWEQWAAQEDAHYSVHQPWTLAHEVRNNRSATSPL